MRVMLSSIRNLFLIRNPHSAIVLTAYCLLLTAFYLLRPAHVRPERFGDDDRAVLTLIVFENREPSATDGKPRPVERVDVFGLRAARASEAYLRAPRLVRLEVRARRDFAERVLRRQPDLYVVSLCRARADVAGRERDDSVVKA